MAAKVRAARDYLEQRGVGGRHAQRFGFGFAPDNRGKLQKRAEADSATTMLVEAGLLIKAEDDKEPYDRFRGRLMFPIRDRARTRASPLAAASSATASPNI